MSELGHVDPRLQRPGTAGPAHVLVPFHRAGTRRPIAAPCAAKPRALRLGWDAREGDVEGMPSVAGLTRPGG